MCCLVPMQLAVAWLVVELEFTDLAVSFGSSAPLVRLGDAGDVVVDLTTPQYWRSGERPGRG